MKLWGPQNFIIMSIEADLEQLAELVESADFRAKQEAFYARHCHEFVAEVDEGSSNKLSYTTIHNTYVEEVENDICVAMGQEALSNIMSNMALAPRHTMASARTRCRSPRAPGKRRGAPGVDLLVVKR